MRGVKGHPKWGGRKKGTPNKRTVALMELCEQKGFSPFENMLELTVHPDVQIRFQALKEVCQYLYPKRKALEMSGEVDLRVLERAKELETLSDEELKKIVGL